VVRDRTAAPPAQRTASELSIPVHDLARSVLSSVLILGAAGCQQSLALTELLRYEGVDAATARDSSLNTTHARDLILVDCDVVALDGLGTFLADIRGSHPDLPVVLLTGWPEFEPRMSRAISIVEGWYVMKPVDIGELLTMIRCKAPSLKSAIALAGASSTGNPRPAMINPPRIGRPRAASASFNVLECFVTYCDIGCI
jgi:CheY-like chemotaxis protein